MKKVYNTGTTFRFRTSYIFGIYDIDSRNVYNRYHYFLSEDSSLREESRCSSSFNASKTSLSSSRPAIILEIFFVLDLRLLINIMITTATAAAIAANINRRGRAEPVVLFSGLGGPKPRKPWLGASSRCGGL